MPENLVVSTELIMRDSLSSKATVSKGTPSLERNVSFRISLRGLFHIISSIDTVKHYLTGFKL